MKLSNFVIDNIKWFGEDYNHRQSSVRIFAAIMPLMVGGGNGRADRNVMCVLFLLAAVVLLSVGVVAVPEEHVAAVQEQPQQEVVPF